MVVCVAAAPHGATVSTRLGHQPLGLLPLGLLPPGPLPPYGRRCFGSQVAESWLSASLLFLTGPLCLRVLGISLSGYCLLASCLLGPCLLMVAGVLGRRSLSRGCLHGICVNTNETSPFTHPSTCAPLPRSPPAIHSPANQTFCRKTFRTTGC